MKSNAARIEKEKIVIVLTTPTGNIGSQVLRHLVQAEEPIRVIARDPSRIASDLRERIEVIEDSHGDLSTVSKAFDGADSLFWLVPPDPEATSVDAAYVDFTRPAAKAIEATGLKRAVVVSALGRGWKKPAGLVTSSLKADDLLASTGVNLRVLTMPSFMDNLLSQAETIKETGVLSWPSPGDLKAPAVASIDIAEVAARLLLDHSWTGQASVPVLGPEDLSMNEMAQIMSQVLGRPVRFEETDMDLFAKQMSGYGFSDAMVQGYVEMMTAKKEGMDTMEPRTSKGTTPTTFRQWCEDALKPAVLG
jgi:uncharacterized protein YbjT (DUF2867 family)